MVLKNACRFASALILMLGAVSASSVASAVHEGRGRERDWNAGHPHAHIAVRKPHHYSGHTGARGDGYAAAFSTGGAAWSEPPHIVRVGPNGSWLTSSWGCWIDEAQDRIVDCDSGNR